MRALIPGSAFGLLLLIGACVSRGDGTYALYGPTEESVRLRYRDGQVSRNDACAIKLSNALNPRVRPLYVNGSPVGFC
jgi:hypothetical protein